MTMNGVNFHRTYGFGDSLFGMARFPPIGRAKDHGECAPGLLFRKLGSKLAGDAYENLAAPGSTSTLIAARVKGMLAYRMDAATCVFLDMGINDIGMSKKRDGLLTTHARGSHVEADKLSDRMVTNLKTACAAIPESATVFLTTLPSFHVLQPPSYTLTDNERVCADSHIAYFNNNLRQLLSTSTRFRIIDFGLWYERVLLNPPKVGDLQLVGFPKFGSREYVTVDGVHPGAIAHGLLANEVVPGLFSEQELLGLWK